MTKKEFKEIINLMIKSHATHQTAYDIGIDTLEFNPSDEKVIDKLWRQVLNEAGCDWLNWYLYDKYGISGTPNKNMKAYDNKKEICQSIDKLYEYLSKQKYFKLP
tara:strand:+ start:56 stop:370 length:315 start_codon:yes stop_codon:yes gene_type:complete